MQLEFVNTMQTKDYNVNGCEEFLFFIRLSLLPTKMPEKNLGACQFYHAAKRASILRKRASLWRRLLRGAFQKTKKIKLVPWAWRMSQLKSDA